ncbi:MAG: SAM-dependent methyltransferase [Dehalococcoidales bacterium]|jgi:SAM-dependent methyltransferase|nr:SAM-dependent methyltransferase [Dehalococcoidales bacterium]
MVTSSSHPPPLSRGNKGATVIRDIFDQIAPSWYNFRHWSIFTKELEVLAKRWQKGKLLNPGCAHGADFLPFKHNFELYGVDFSPEMIKYAKKYALKFNLEVKLKVADVRHLPYPDETFDWAISVATYHHIKGKAERQKALGELKRVLKPRGEAFITVWNRNQPKFWFKPKDIAIPWRQKSKTLYRYYYLFSYGELEKLVKEAGFQVLKSFPESSYHFPLKAFSRNICLLVKKST